MKKSLAIAVVSAFIMSATAGAMAANSTSTGDNKFQAAGKKVGAAIVWPFKKIGQGAKAVKKKLTGG